MSQSLWHFVTESGESGFSRWCPDHNRLMRCRSGWMINYRWHTDSETSTLWQTVSMIHADQELQCDCMAASWAFCQWHIVIEIDVVPFITLLWDCCSLGGLSRSCSDVSWSRRTVPRSYRIFYCFSRSQTIIFSEEHSVLSGSDETVEATTTGAAIRTRMYFIIPKWIAGLVFCMVWSFSSIELYLHLVTQNITHDSLGSTTSTEKAWFYWRT